MCCVLAVQGGRREEGKGGGGSGSRSIADKIVERSRRSVELRKVTNVPERERERDNRRKSAPMPRRYASSYWEALWIETMHYC